MRGFPKFLGLALLAGALVGCAPGPVDNHVPGVLIIAVDALRADLGYLQ